MTNKGTHLPLASLMTTVLAPELAVERGLVEPSSWGPFFTFGQNCRA